MSKNYYNQNDKNTKKSQHKTEIVVENDSFNDSDRKELLSIQNQEDSKIESVKDLLKKLENFVKKDGKTISTSQLRNIFSKIKKEKTVVGLQLLRPKLAYISARQSKSKKFIIAIDKVLQQVSTTDDVKGFHYFFEAIVAYHKFHCGEKKQ